MKIIFTEKALKLYRKLPLPIKKKADKQFIFLATNTNHPSLRLKKMEGLHRWEARIDKSYRFTFEKTADSLLLRTIGQHDEGLGKK